MDFESEQEELLDALVEDARSVPRSEREGFTLVVGEGYAFIQGAGGHRTFPDFQPSDLDVFRRAGLIAVLSYADRGKGFSFYVTPHGFSHYGERKRQSREPAQQVEHEIVTYLDSARFQNAYPGAYARWREAADLLWGAESGRELSTIGHKCREAIQEFATALVERDQPADVNPDKAKTRDRLLAVVALRRPQLGEARSDLLDALFKYWCVVGDLSQRQEHAGQREGEPLSWEDGRRVVFQTAVVMFEIDRAI